MATCASSVGAGQCRIFSVRADGVRVATIEIRAAGADTRYPIVKQVRGARNGDVDAAVWRAVYAWLAGQPGYSLARPGKHCFRHHVITWSRVCPVRVAQAPQSAL